MLHLILKLVLVDCDLVNPLYWLIEHKVVMEIATRIDPLPLWHFTFRYWLLRLGLPCHHSFVIIRYLNRLPVYIC